MARQDVAELEWQTRQRLVDPKLQAQGWKVTPFRDGAPLTAYEKQAVTEFPTDNGPADYAPCEDSRVLS